MHVGIAGEVRCVVTKANGTVKTDTGFQKNLILNQGLDFFGGGKGTRINAYCAIGSGNSVPTPTQTGLDSFISMVSDTPYLYRSSYTDEGDGLYRIWQERKYRFTNLNGVNISEVALVSTGTTGSNYHATTRALIKDSLGAASSISVKTGETLDIYYRIHQVFSTTDANSTINMLDGDGGSVPYEVTCRLANVGSSEYAGVGTGRQGIGYVFDTAYTSGADAYAYTGELGEITGKPLGQIDRVTSKMLANYTPSSYKRIYGVEIGLTQLNADIRSFYFQTTMGHYQLRYGSADGDNPIVKTANDTLIIPLEFSWGRFEGEL